jgi:hypothetical protein
LPELDLIAGPNGSGKSTFGRQVQNGLRAVDYSIPPIINPDEIARRLSPTNPDAGAAARDSLVARGEALSAGKSFSIETTLSGKPELRLIADAQARGYPRQCRRHENDRPVVSCDGDLIIHLSNSFVNTVRVDAWAARIRRQPARTR